MDPLLIYTKTIKLDATQVDAFGRMRPSALLEITQEAAGEHANLLGVGRDALGSHGLFWAIVHLARPCRPHRLSPLCPGHHPGGGGPV